MALVHCRECGEMISETAPTCPKCGADQGLTNSGSSVVLEGKDPSIGLNIISCIFLIVGLILYIVYTDKSPRRAKQIGKWILIGVVARLIITIIFYLVLGGAALIAGLAANSY